MSLCLCVFVSFCVLVTQEPSRNKNKLFLVVACLRKNLETLKDYIDYFDNKKKGHFERQDIDDHFCGSIVRYNMLR